MNGFKTIIVADRQSISDLAKQEYGCYEGWQLILRYNGDKLDGLHDVPDPGTELLIQSPVPKLTDTNQLIAAQYATLRHTIVNGAIAIPVPRNRFRYVEQGYWDLDYTEL